MSIYIGNNKYKEIYLGSNKISEVYLGSNKIFSGADPYNPLGLPPLTIRVKLTSGTISVTNATVTAVAGQANVYDICTLNGKGTNWYQLLYDKTNISEVLGANATGVTNMGLMFFRCSSLTKVPLFDTSSVTAMNSMFTACTNLTGPIPFFNTSNVTNLSAMFSVCSNLTGSIPLFDTSKVTDMSYMFYNCSKLSGWIPLFDTYKVTNVNNMYYNCINIEGGLWALYTQLVNQTTPPTSHSSTFTACGSNTVNGSEELSIIPSDWK